MEVRAFSALLLAGVLTVREYFGEQSEIGRLAESIYEAVDFRWMLNGDPRLLSMGLETRIRIPPEPLGSVLRVDDPLFRRGSTNSKGNWLRTAQCRSRAIP